MDTRVTPHAFTPWRWTSRATSFAAIGSTAFAAIYAAQTIALQSIESRPANAWPIIVVSGAQWWVWGLLSPVVFALANRFPVTRDSWHTAVPLHLLAAAAMSVVHATLIALVVMQLPFGDMPRTFGMIFSSYAYSRLQSNLLIYIALLAVHAGLVQASLARERAVHAVALEGALARAELDALRMQLNPHFLFNTLHAIRTLVEADPTAARQMLLRLGDLLHATLDASAQQESSLEDELTLLRGYLDIEATRFADRLRVEFDVPSSLRDARVPSFVLQPLAENAVRHGIAQRVAGGTIHISAREESGALRIVMVNDAPSSPAKDTRGHGVGLASTRARLLRLYGPAASVSLSLHDNQATLDMRLPLRRGDP